MERIVEQRQGKNIYYYYSNAYRVKINPEDKGKTRNTGKSKVVNEQVYLGKAKDILEKCREAEEQQKPQVVKKFEFGLPLALYNQAMEIDLVKIIDKHIPKRKQGLSVGEYILLSAISRVTRAIPKTEVNDFLEKTALKNILLKKQKNIKSQNFYCAYEKVLSEKEIKGKKEGLGKLPNDKLKVDELEEVINENVIEKIEEELWFKLQEKYNIHLNVFLYDTSNFFTFIDKYTECSIPQAGHNKQQKHNKRQIGLALAILKELQLPILHKVYCGNINDVELFPSAIRKLITRCQRLKQDIKGLVLVFDKGNNSAKNIEELDNIENLSFIGSVAPSNHKDLLKIKLEEYKDEYKDEKVYSCYKEVFGKKRKIVITYNEDTKKRQCDCFNKRTKDIKKELNEIFLRNKNKNKEDIIELLNKKLNDKKINQAKASYYLYPEIKEKENDKFLEIKHRTYRVKIKKLSFGKTILISDDLNKSNEEIISNYRDKNKIENVFRLFNSKDEVPAQPFYHFSDSKIVVQAFCLVIALLLVKLLEYKAKINNLGMSTRVLLQELKDITEVIMIYRNRRVHKEICEMTTIQKKLFDLYKLKRFT